MPFPSQCGHTLVMVAQGNIPGVQIKKEHQINYDYSGTSQPIAHTFLHILPHKTERQAYQFDAIRT